MLGTPGPDGLAGAPDPGADLAGADLAGADLIGADLAGADLIGRAADVTAVRRLLGGARLVTVTGLAGVGKSAVALAAASAAASSFADGSLLLRLDALRDEALLPHTIAAALQQPDDYTRGCLPVLAEQLRDRHLLLIMDTCEHLLGACAGLVAALLPSCPKMAVLATSREPLRVPGEAVAAIRPLRLAEAGHCRSTCPGTAPTSSRSSSRAPSPCPPARSRTRPRASSCSPRAPGCPWGAPPVWSG